MLLKISLSYWIHTCCTQALRLLNYQKLFQKLIKQNRNHLVLKPNFANCKHFFVPSLSLSDRPHLSCGRLVYVTAGLKARPEERKTEHFN